MFCFMSFSGKSSELLETEKQIINVYKQTVPAVVNVSNIVASNDLFFGPPQRREAGVGSGFIWDIKGHIVTNFHVVQDRQNEFYISFHGSKEPVKAKVVGIEPKFDIAVLKVEKLPSNVTPVRVGKSSDLQVGQIGIAIGNPFGLDYTLTTGVISALGRSIPGIAGVKINDMIQTDADINPGNSGGPLINSQGQLIGMNTMIYSSSGASAGVGFAVPVDAISNIVPQLIEHGKIIRPALGISPLPEEYRARFTRDKEGVVIAYVLEGSPADRAGLKGMRRDQRGRLYLGDTILAIDSNQVNNLDDIFHTLNKYKVGDNVQLKIKKDNGKVDTVPMKLQAI